jgi:hypothetical protein
MYSQYSASLFYFQLLGEQAAVAVILMHSRFYLAPICQGSYASLKAKKVIEGLESLQDGFFGSRALSNFQGSKMYFMG